MRFRLGYFLVSCVLMGAVAVPAIHSWHEHARKERIAKRLEAQRDRMESRVLVAKEELCRAKEVLKFMEHPLMCHFDGGRQLQSDREGVKKSERELKYLGVLLS